MFTNEAAVNWRTVDSTGTGELREQNNSLETRNFAFIIDALLRGKVARGEKP